MTATPRPPRDQPRPQTHPARVRPRDHVLRSRSQSRTQKTMKNLAHHHRCDHATRQFRDNSSAAATARPWRWRSADESTATGLAVLDDLPGFRDRLQLLAAVRLPSVDVRRDLDNRVDDCLPRFVTCSHVRFLSFGSFSDTSTLDPSTDSERPIVASVRLCRSGDLAPRVLAAGWCDHRVTTTAADLRERAVDRIRNPLIGGAR